MKDRASPTRSYKSNGQPVISKGKMMYPTKGQNKSTQALHKVTQRMFVEPILQESNLNNSSISISAPKMREL